MNLRTVGNICLQIIFFFARIEKLRCGTLEPRTYFVIYAGKKKNSTGSRKGKKVINLVLSYV